VVECRLSVYKTLSLVSTYSQRALVHGNMHVYNDKFISISVIFTCVLNENIQNKQIVLAYKYIETWVYLASTLAY
jgi:hypothetical protein